MSKPSNQGMPMGEDNPVLWRSALKALERYMDCGLYHKGDKSFPELAKRVIDKARKEAKKDATDSG